MAMNRHAFRWGVGPVLAGLMVAPVAPLGASPAGAGSAQRGQISTLSGSSQETNHLSVNGVSCPTTSDCWAVGSNSAGAGAIVATSDGGLSWSTQALPRGTGSLDGVDCPTRSDCWAVGSNSAGKGAVVVTTDGGLSWSTQALPRGTNSLDGVSCPTTLDCWAVAGTGVDGEWAQTAGVVATTDGGGTWGTQVLPSGVLLLDGVSCPTPTNCWATGVDSNTGFAVIVATTDGGSSWATQTVPSFNGEIDSILYDVSCPTSTDCWAVGFGDSISPPPVGPSGSSYELALVVATTDGGRTWSAQTLPSSYSSGDDGEIFSGIDYLDGVSCPTSTDCWAAGFGSDGIGAVAVTTDGGSTWSNQILPSSSSGGIFNGIVWLGGVSCPTSTDCWVAGLNSFEFGVVVATTDGGSTWSTQALVDRREGYWLAAENGAVFAAGGAPGLGGTRVPNSDPVVAIAATADSRGYWLVTANGTVFPFGDAKSYGTLPALGVDVDDIVGMAPSAAGGGYWLIGADGGMFAFGDARYHGSLPGDGIKVSDIVGMVAAPSGAGYVIVGADGGVFAFGATHYYGSLPGSGVKVSDIRAILPAPGGTGYVLVGADGGTFIFGHGAPYEGSLPGEGVTVSDVVGIALTPDGEGYWLAGRNGTTHAFGDATPFPAPSGLEAALPIAAIGGT
jgi:photosystem II stability/assembly factor-like uncharacterized protein